MAKKKSTVDALAGLSELKAQWERLTEKSRANFRSARHSHKFITERLGINPTTLRNWLTRGFIVPLDADEKRDGRAWRFFSTRDAVALAAAQVLGRLGLPTEALELVVPGVLKAADLFLFQITALKRGTISLYIYWDAGEWNCVTNPDNLPNIDREILAEAYVVFELERFFHRVLSELDVPFFSGTADEFQATADKMKRDESQ